MIHYRIVERITKFGDRIFDPQRTWGPFWISLTSWPQVNFADAEDCIKIHRGRTERHKRTIVKIHNMGTVE